jgi:hypothetical protein
MEPRELAVAEETGCPFAVPGVPRSGAAFYCRLPNGRVRIPARDERVRFCESGRYHACPVIQRYAF